MELHPSFDAACLTWLLVGEAPHEQLGARYDDPDDDLGWSQVVLVTGGAMKQPASMLRGKVITRDEAVTFVDAPGGALHTGEGGEYTVGAMERRMSALMFGASS